MVAPAPRPALRLHLLGDMQITLDGAPVRGFLTAKVPALLCYLAVVPRLHSRAGLATLLWGDLPTEQAAHGLRQALSNLQKLIGPHLIVTRQAAGLDPSCPWSVDTTDFRRLLIEAEQAPFGRHRRLRQAVALYRGDFLDGLTVRQAAGFHEWVATEREGLRQLVLDSLHRLAVHHLGRGEYAVAAADLRQLLALDPWREDAHRQLMVLLAYNGQPDAALAQYRLCRRVLQDEFGEDPAAETTALYRQIRAGVLPAPPAPPGCGNLPAAPAALVGRQEDVATLVARVEAPACRLLTLVGPGGMGKTSLAVQVAMTLAADFAHGAYWVDLAAVRDPTLVARAIAGVLEIPEVPGQPPPVTLAAALRDRELLLVLDNFEQIVAAADLLPDLLAEAPRLKILVTSRVRLHLRNEYLYEVRPLAVPPRSAPASAPLVGTFPAVAMFVARGQAVRPGFGLTEANAGTVAAICAQLEGIPLALELAAARLQSLSLPALLAGLDRRLPLLTGGFRDLPTRQQTLRATLAWSYALLPAPQQTLLAGLAIFVGGFTAEAATAVLGGEAADGIDLLVYHSLVQSGDGPRGATRYGMLETVREYAAEVLQAGGQQDVLAAQHAAYFLALAEAAEPYLRGSDHGAWLDRLEADYANLRAALDWAIGQGAALLSWRLTGALWQFWGIRGYATEGHTYLTRALALPPLPDPAAQAARANALLGAGYLAQRRADYAAADLHYKESETLYRALGATEQLANVLLNRASLALYQHDMRAVQALSTESLTLATRPHMRARILNLLGALAEDRHDDQAAQEHVIASVALYRLSGDQFGLGYGLTNLGSIMNRRGNRAEARRLHTEALALRHQLADRWGITSSLMNLGEVDEATGELAAAYTRYLEALHIRRDLGDPLALIETVESLIRVTVALDPSAVAQAAPLWRAATALRETRGLPPRDAITYGWLGADWIAVQAQLPAAGPAPTLSLEEIIAAALALRAS